MVRRIPILYWALVAAVSALALYGGYSLVRVQLDTAIKADAAFRYLAAPVGTRPDGTPLNRADALADFLKQSYLPK